jgi:glyoxylate carboligase
MTSAAPMRAIEARRTFLVEDEGADDAFAMPGWRGAMLYSAAYGWHGLPPVLRDALRRVGGASRARGLARYQSPMKSIHRYSLHIWSVQG